MSERKVQESEEKEPKALVEVAYPYQPKLNAFLSFHTNALLAEPETWLAHNRLTCAMSDNAHILETLREDKNNRVQPNDRLTHTVEYLSWLEYKSMLPNPFTGFLLSLMT